MKKDKSKIGSKLIVVGIITTITFLILKFTFVIDWQWLWIFAPLWMSLGLNIIINLISETIRDISMWYKNRKINN